MQDCADNELNKQSENDSNKTASNEIDVVQEVDSNDTFLDALNEDAKKDHSTKQFHVKSASGAKVPHKVIPQFFRYANSSIPSFGSPPQSPLVGLIFNPFGNNFGGECEMGDRNSNNDRQLSWTSSNQDPIGTGAKKKIVKTQDKHCGYSGEPRYAHDKFRDNECDRQRKDKNFHSGSTSSLDFYIEGEKMVSELCSFNETSCITKTDSYTQKEHFKSTNKGEDNPKRSSSSDVLLTGLDKIVIHDQIPNQIVQLAIEACTDAENIAIAHHNRPCFKNIHSICAKTRSNVQKPDSAVANLHSQGVPWVIKNFIFSFVRILDGWKGVKELLCEKHDTFSRIENKYYSPNIRECFVQWQAVTKEMLTHIYKTFKCLDHGFTMEQKSFTHNYYSTNSPGPRSQSQTKFQPVKPHVSIARPINPSAQSFNAIQPPWIQNQQSNQAFQDTSWTARPSVSYKKIPVIPVQNSNNLFTFSDQNDVEIFQRAHYKETKPRQSWTITNVHDYRSLEGTCQSDHRDVYAHLRYNFDAELGKTPGSTLNPNLNYDLLLRRELELKSKLLPLSHVEKTLVPNNDIRSCYIQRNNSCGDTKEENDFFASWGQIVQKETNDFITNQGNSMQFSTNAVPISNTSGPVQYIDHENEEFHEMSKVYMKPGSYKVPIKPDAIPSYNISSTLPDMAYDSNVNDQLSNLKIKSPRSSVTLAPNPRYNLESWPCVMSRRGEDTYGEESKQVNRVGSSYLDFKRPDQIDMLNCVTSDRAWEAAKQSAPKLMDIIHDGSKSDTARLYDALGLNNVNEEYLDHNSQEFWPINQLLPNSMINLWDEESSDKKNESIESENVSSLEVEKECTDTDTKRIVKEKVIKSDQNTKEELGKKGVSKQKISGWYHPKKKKVLSTAVVKKFEEILHSLSQMQEAKCIQNDINFKKAPKFYDIVRYPIFLHDIGTKLKNSYYAEQEQIIQDIRRIFNNTRLYLKSCPDAAIKKNVNKVSTAFEKLLTEDKADVKAKSHDHRNDNDNKAAAETKENSDKTTTHTRTNSNKS